jgi:hypothetical protein
MVLLPDPPFKLMAPWDRVAFIRMSPEPPIIVVEAVPEYNVLFPVLDAAVSVFVPALAPLEPLFP